MERAHGLCGRSRWPGAAGLHLALSLALALPATHDARHHAGSAQGTAFANARAPLDLRQQAALPVCLHTASRCAGQPGASGAGVARLLASSVRVDEFGRRQGSGGEQGSFRQGSGGMPGGVVSASRILPSGSLREQREMLNQVHAEREAWYDLMKRRVRASSYQDGAQDIRRLFSQFDTNKNGALDWSEYRTLLTRMGMRPFSITDEDLRILFYEMGATGRGFEVRAREFFSWISGNRRDGVLQDVAEQHATGGVAEVPTSTPADQSSSWTYGESIWWDEGSEQRVLQTIDAAATIRASGRATRLPRTGSREVAVAPHPAAGNDSGAVASQESVARALAPVPRTGASEGQQTPDFRALLDAVEPWTCTSPERLHAAVYFLVNEIGLPESKVKALALETPAVFSLDVDAQLRPRIDDLRALGVPVEKIAKLLAAVPDLLGSQGWEKRQEAIRFLNGLGIEPERVGPCLVRHPRVLDLSVEAMAAVVEFLVGAGRIPRSKLSKIVEAMPSVLGHSVDLNLRPKVTFLTEDVGISHERMAAVLTKFPQVLGLSVECNLRPTVRYLIKDLGVAQEDLSRILSSMPQLLGLSVEGNLKVKVRYLVADLGIPEEQLADVIVKCPSLLSLSVEKNLQPKVRFLIEEAGFSREDVIRAPNVLAYSIDRMRKRHRFLTEKGLKLGLASMVSYSNADFQKRFDHDGDLL